MPKASIFRRSGEGCMSSSVSGLVGRLRGSFPRSGIFIGRNELSRLNFEC